MNKRPSNSTYISFNLENMIMNLGIRVPEVAPLEVRDATKIA